MQELFGMYKINQNKCTPISCLGFSPQTHASSPLTYRLLVPRQDEEPGDGGGAHRHGDGDGVIPSKAVHGGRGNPLANHQGLVGDASVVQGEGQVPGEGGACRVEDHGKASVFDTRVNVKDAVKVCGSRADGREQNECKVTI